MYVCGPTVYGEPHLGHARSAITYDIAFRYLKYLGYKVRYVRNITDVGHLEDEIEESGEDKFPKEPAWRNWSRWKWSTTTRLSTTNASTC